MGKGNGTISILDNNGSRILKKLKVLDGKSPVTSIILAKIADEPAVVAGYRGILKAFNLKGRLLWQNTVSHDVTPCLQAVSNVNPGGDIVVCGATYHSSLWIFSPDGTRLASPWFWMDSTTQCMSALCIDRFCFGKDPSILWGTLGHTVFAMPMPGDGKLQRDTYGKGKASAELRMAAPVIFLEVIKIGNALRLVTVDESGHVAVYGRNLKRIKWFWTGFTSRHITAAVTGSGMLVVATENSELSLSDLKTLKNQQWRP